MNKTQIKIITDIVIKAGEIALKYFNKSDLNVERKADNSPVTKADKLISELISNGLKKNFPDIPIICEERKNREINGNKFWLIDPIDGTKSFIKKEKEFTVNIALIEDKKPIFGVIYAPKIIDSPMYYIDENQNLVRFLVNKNLSKTMESDLRIKEENIKIISSHRANDDEIIDYIKKSFHEIDPEKVEIIKMSSSFKFCQMIEGKADIFLSLKPTMEWDTAAGHALMLANNKKVFTLSRNRELQYQKDDLVNKGCVVY